MTKGKTSAYVHDEPALKEYLAQIGGEAEVQRYKGLGEMDAIQLWDTTMDPARRTLLQVTPTSPIEEDALFTILMGENVEPRKEFIEQNSKLVADLDI